jgi:hypothetical protein
VYGSCETHTIDLLYTLTSFETFDTLAGPARSLEEVAPLIQRLLHTILNDEASQ